MGILMGLWAMGKLKVSQEQVRVRLMADVTGAPSMWCFAWNWTCLYFLFIKGCGGLNQHFLPDLQLMTLGGQVLLGP